MCLKCKSELRRKENFLKKLQNLWILNFKATSSVQNLFAYLPDLKP
jgi:hypothetical protein